MTSSTMPEPADAGIGWQDRSDMPTFDIRITRRDNQQQLSLTVREYATAALTQSFQNVCTRHNGVESRTRALRTAPQLSTRTQVIKGTTCRILSVSTDPHLATKLAALQKVLETLSGQQNGIGMPNDELEVCMVSAQSNPQTSFSNMSVGFVYQDPNNSPTRQRVCLILGDSICEKGGDTLIADAVYDYYKPTFTVNAKQRRAMAAIYHEFGHIYHQLRNPHHYWAIQDIQVASMAKADVVATTAEYATFFGAPSHATLKGMADAMKGYGQLLSGYATKHPNEVVAETFSALMMGVPLDQAQIETYQQMGGFMPPTNVRHTRTGQNAFKRKVLYPIAQAVGFIGE